jgi:hypothetical protein
MAVLAREMGHWFAAGAENKLKTGYEELVDLVSS